MTGIAELTCIHMCVYVRVTSICNEEKIWNGELIQSRQLHIQGWFSVKSGYLNPRTQCKKPYLTFLASERLRSLMYPIMFWSDNSNVSVLTSFSVQEWAKAASSWFQNSIVISLISINSRHCSHWSTKLNSVFCHSTSAPRSYGFVRH